MVLDENFSSVVNSKVYWLKGKFHEFLEQKSTRLSCFLMLKTCMKGVLERHINIMMYPQMAE